MFKFTDDWGMTPSYGEEVSKSVPQTISTLLDRMLKKKTVGVPGRYCGFGSRTLQ